MTRLKRWQRSRMSSFCFMRGSDLTTSTCPDPLERHWKVPESTVAAATWLLHTCTSTAVLAASRAVATKLKSCVSAGSRTRFCDERVLLPATMRRVMTWKVPPLVTWPELTKV